MMCGVVQYSEALCCVVQFSVMSEIWCSAVHCSAVRCSVMMFSDL